MEASDIAMSSTNQLKALLSKSDWNEILTLLQKKTYQRKFQIIEAFTELASKKGFYQITHGDIAKYCGVTRQLVDHHFPDKTSLIALTYKYIYAGFQKKAADAIMTKQGFLNQLQGYLYAVIEWINEKRTHARFLVQFYALLQVDPKFADLQERNLKIGRERIASLLTIAQDEELLSPTSKDKLLELASSLQNFILGLLVMNSWKPHPISKIEREEFWKRSLALLRIRLPKN